MEEETTKKESAASVLLQAGTLIHPLLPIYPLKDIFPKKKEVNETILYFHISPCVTNPKSRNPLWGVEPILLPTKAEKKIFTDKSIFDDKQQEQDQTYNRDQK